MPDYDAIYRDLHPPRFPFSPYERRQRLSDLWESDQEDFKRKVDKVLAHERESLAHKQSTRPHRISTPQRRESKET